ncbi:MAG: hypothetical protein AB7N24_12165 [Dehalococcoidia bacterium]
MRPFPLAGLAVVAVLLLGACGDGPDKPEPTATAEPEDTGPITGLPVLGQAEQELEFNGVVEGTMIESSASCAWLHDPAGGLGKFQMALRGLVGAEAHTFRVLIDEYDGPGDYSWDGVAGSGPKILFELDGKQTGHGTIFVDETGAGEMDVTITTPDQGRVHGYFNCPGIPR